MISRTLGVCAGAASAGRLKLQASSAQASPTMKQHRAIMCVSFLRATQSSQNANVGRMTTLFQKALSTKPMGGMIGPTGDLRVSYGTQAIAMAAVAVHMEFCRDSVFFQARVEEHGA